MFMFAADVTTVTPIALLGGIGMLLVGLGFIAYALARRLGRRMLMWGALAWVITVAFKFAWAIPLNAPIYRALHASLPANLADPIMYVYVGALTGVFEVGLTWLALRYTRLGHTAWAGALAFGIGFGAIEAILLALNPLIAVTTALVNPSAIPANVLDQLAALNNPLQGFAPVWERFFTIWVHILSAALLFYGIRVRQARWFWLAFLYKTGIDTVAAFAQISGLVSLAGLDNIARLWSIELVVGVWGVIGWLGTRWVSRHFPPDETPSGSSAPLSFAPSPDRLSPQP